jgi:hypothetical protein
MLLGLVLCRGIDQARVKALDVRRHGPRLAMSGRQAVQSSKPAGCAATSSWLMFAILSIAAPPSVSSCMEIVRAAQELSND